MYNTVESQIRIRGINMNEDWMFFSNRIQFKRKLKTTKKQTIRGTLGVSHAKELVLYDDTNEIIASAHVEQCSFKFNKSNLYDGIIINDNKWEISFTALVFQEGAIFWDLSFWEILGSCIGGLFGGIIGGVIGVIVGTFIDCIKYNKIKNIKSAMKKRKEFLELIEKMQAGA
jgi:hypothetical protein